MPSIMPRGEEQAYCVKNVSWKGHFKRLSSLPLGSDDIFVENEDSVFFDVPLSACVTTNDVIVARGRHLSVRCKEGFAQLAPAYLQRERLIVGGLEVNILIKEITQADEYDS